MAPPRITEPSVIGAGSAPTRESVESFIADATARLKGPMRNLERQLLVADRKDARAMLAKLTETQP